MNPSRRIDARAARSRKGEFEAQVDAVMGASRTLVGIAAASVAVPVPYNQWTQFESFPQFMEGVESVQQLDDPHLLWIIKIGLTARNFHATITEQHPDQRIAWKSDGLVRHAGVVTSHRLDDTHCRITAQMDIDPGTVTETVADKTGIIRHRVEGDMQRFKHLVEARGSATGSWRGNIDPPGSSSAPSYNP